MHWILRIGDASNFNNSKKLNIWALKSWAPDGKNFLSNAKEGDILWFLTNYTRGRKLIGVAKFIRTTKRVLGPLFPLTKTNEDLGWGDGNWDVEINFEDLYCIESLDMCLDVKHKSSISKSSTVASDIDFELEYKNIVKYSNVRLAGGF